MKFRSGTVVLAALGLSLVAVTGCGGPAAGDTDLISPRSVVVAFHQAVAAKDYDGVAKCTAPAYRRTMRSLLAGWKDYSVKTLQTAALVEQRIDPAPAGKLRAELDQTYLELLPSPLAGAVHEDKVNWDAVNIAAQNDSATVEVGRKATPFGKRFNLVRVGAAWYVEPLDDTRAFTAWAKRTTKEYAQLVKELGSVQSRIRKGQVNQENIEKELWPGG